MPYVVPEGYFSELEERLGAIPRRNVAVSRFDKLKPYVALAAAFLIIVTCGTLCSGLHPVRHPTAIFQCSTKLRSLT